METTSVFDATLTCYKFSQIIYFALIMSQVLLFYSHKSIKGLNKSHWGGGSLKPPGPTLGSKYIAGFDENHNFTLHMDDLFLRFLLTTGTSVNVQQL